MADAAPPKKSGPARWILLGCGLLTGLFILGTGSCAGVLYFVYKGTDPVAEVGAAYLRSSPELKSAMVEDFVVKRNTLGWNVNVHNDGGNARIAYTLRHPSAADMKFADAVVWLIRSNGKWTAVAARVDRGGELITIGKPPAEHRIHLDD